MLSLVQQRMMEELKLSVVDIIDSNDEPSCVATLLNHHIVAMTRRCWEEQYDCQAKVICSDGTQTHEIIRLGNAISDYRRYTAANGIVEIEVSK